MANNEQKSIVEVFGEKSKDGDDMKQNLGMLLSQLIQPREIRRRESEYPREEYGVLEDEQIEALKTLEPFMKDLQSKKSKKWSDKSYEAAIDYARDSGTNIDRNLIHSALSSLTAHALPSREDKFGGTLGFFEDYEETKYGTRGKGNLISPLELNELLIEEDIAMEKPGYPERQQLPPEMQPMEKGKGMMALLQRLIPGGKTGYKKYKNGGFLGFGKKKKSENGALEALNAILSERVVASGELDPSGRRVAHERQSSDGSNLIRVISQFINPEGDIRYYPGEGKSRNVNLADQKAMINAMTRAATSPADSITTDQLGILQELGLFGK